MKFHKISKRIISTALIISTICLALASCAKKIINDSPTDSDDSHTVEINNNGSDVVVEESQDESNNTPSNESQNNSIKIFENGTYLAKIIKGDEATAIEKQIYDEIREALREFTGVNPDSNSDYTAENGEKYTGPAILIGETSFDESKSAYEKLENNQATATIYGNKYVIAFSSTDAVNNIVEKFKSFLTQKATKDSIVIDSSWEAASTIIVEEKLETFDPTGLISSAEIPKYNGAALKNENYAGQSCYTYIQPNTTSAEFKQFCEDLASAGFRFYTDNEINENKFATYVTQTQIVHVMYFKSRNEARIAVDKRGEGKNGFDLPGLSGENQYTKTTTPSLTMVEIDNTGYGGGMCFIYKLSNGKFFIVDSGISEKTASYSTSSAQWIYKTLKELAGSEKIVVAGWLITHVHSDHIGGLYDMSKDAEITKNITIERLIHNEPTDELTMQLEGLTSTSSKDIWKWMNPITEAFGIKSVIKAHPGQVLYFADAKVTILASQDVTLDSKNSLKDSNDLSVVSQIEFNDKKILMLGDAITYENKFLAQVYGKSLKSDILQVTHHGLNNSGADTAEGDPNSVNQLCDPDIALWAAGYNVSGNRDKFDMSLNWAMNAYLKNNATNYGAKDGNVTFDEKWNVKTPNPTF